MNFRPFYSFVSMVNASASLNGRGKPLQAVLDPLKLYGAILAMGVAMLVTVVCFLPFAAIASPLIRRQRAQRIIAAMFRYYLVFVGWLGLARVDYAGLDALVGRGPLLVVANHPCLLDAMLIMSRLPASVCVMKSHLSRNPLLGIGSWVAGYVRNDSPVQIVRQCVRALEERSQVVIFPEGTRTRGRPMEVITGAFATIARRSDCPVVLVAIEGSSPFAAKGWPLWRVPEFPLRYRVRVIAEIDPKLTREAMVSATQAAFAAQLTPVVSNVDPVYPGGHRVLSSGLRS